MSVIAINADAKPAKIIPDELFFQMVCEWKKARSQYQALTAEIDKITMGGLREHDASDQLEKQASQVLEQMESIQAHIESWTPESVLTVRASLTMTMDILAAFQAEPEGVLSGGDVLGLIRNAISALEYADSAMALKAEEPTTRALKVAVA